MFFFLFPYPPYGDEQGTMSSTTVLCPSTSIGPFHDLKMLQVPLTSAQTPDTVFIKRKSC